MPLVLTASELELRQSYGLTYKKTENIILLPMAKSAPIDAMKDVFSDADSDEITLFRDEESVYLMESENDKSISFLSINMKFTQLEAVASNRVLTQAELLGFHAHGVNLQFNPAWESYSSGYTDKTSVGLNQPGFVKVMVETLLPNAKAAIPQAQMFVLENVTLTQTELETEEGVQGFYVAGCTLVPVYEKLN